MKVGYVRTRKKYQNPDLQRRDLLAAGCDKLFEEQISSRKADRPQLRAALEFCREGDGLVGDLRERGVEFVTLRESLGRTPPGGKLVFHVFGAVAAFERDLILERTMVGLEAAKARAPRREAPGAGRGKGEAGAALDIVAHWRVARARSFRSPRPEN